MKTFIENPHHFLHSRRTMSRAEDAVAIHYESKGSNKVGIIVCLIIAVAFIATSVLTLI